MSVRTKWFKHIAIYHWGQNDYLPDFYSRRIILGNFVCFVSVKEIFQKELILNYLAKMTLPKSVANYLGNVFVPNGKLFRTIS